MALAPVPTHPRRLAFLGNPDVAVPALRALVGAGYEVALVITGEDRRRGRGAAPTPGPVKAAAATLGLPVSADLDAVVDAAVDLAVVVAYGRLVPLRVLEQVPMVNLHFSLLPRWRGAAPVEHAILAGDLVTGVCLMQLEVALDTGPVFARVETPIADDDLATLSGRLSDLGAGLLVAALGAGLSDAVPQEGEVTYASKLTPADLELDWHRRADELARLVRLGRAWTTFRGKRLLVLSASPARADGPAGAPGTLDGALVTAGVGCLRLGDVRPEGRRAQPADAWLRGARPAAGERLGA